VLPSKHYPPPPLVNVSLPSDAPLVPPPVRVLNVSAGVVERHAQSQFRPSILPPHLLISYSVLSFPSFPFFPQVQRVFPPLNSGISFLRVFVSPPFLTNSGADSARKWLDPSYRSPPSLFLILQFFFFFSSFPEFLSFSNTDPPPLPFPYPSSGTPFLLPQETRCAWCQSECQAFSFSLLLSL